MTAMAFPSPLKWTGFSHPEELTTSHEVQQDLRAAWSMDDFIGHRTRTAIGCSFVLPPTSMTHKTTMTWGTSDSAEKYV
jgi:hypothetical protein